MSVCVPQWLIHWFHNTTWLDLCECWTSANTLWHQIRQTLAFPLRLLSISSHHFNFPFPPSCSSYTPSICRRPLTSPSTPALRFHFLLLDFIFSPVSLFSFFSPPTSYTDNRRPHMHMHKTHACMKMIKSRDVYSTWTDTWFEPAHTCCIFLLKYGSPRGLKWKPIKSDIFHFPLHIVTAWWEPWIF